MIDRRCLSLTRPWELSILYGGKRLENRSWPPPPAVIGKHVLLHTAKSVADDEAIRFISHRWPGLSLLEWDESAPGMIVGAARVRGAFKLTQVRDREDLLEAELAEGSDGRTAYVASRCIELGTFSEPWFMGPWAWVLGDVIAFDVPIGPVKGHQGCWRLDEVTRIKAEGRLRNGLEKLADGPDATKSRGGR